MLESQGTRDLAAAFQNYFTIAPALTQETREEVYRIRHEVYCRDLGWEPIRADGMETDDADLHSVHCLLRQQGTLAPVGCTRLILVRQGKELPFEESCRDALDRGIVDPEQLPRNSIGEVSRLAVVSTFRQRKGEQGVAMTSASETNFAPDQPMPRFPFIPVSLYLAAAAVARHLGVEHVFVLTEPRLASHFLRIGFDIRTVGSPIEHRGTRVPSLLSSSKVVENLRPMIRPLYDVVQQSVEKAFASHPEAIQALKANGWHPGT
ncbi:PEP-CTERM/exosortase system-associated acyltransferase [Roseateles sp. LYH14W]|uniref:PEP-CTERM/exosortase system-associated acyltransferase n=1 Tax=Pelomonas parva TaxID=3299032 RepID=A0ABW7EZR1_9BURK